jgi:hypothetical protein
VLADNTLLKTTCHFLLLLIRLDTLTYRKYYDWSPILVGYHRTSFEEHTYMSLIINVAIYESRVLSSKLMKGLRV